MDVETLMHLYKPDGTPVYEVPYADKKRAGEMRPATLRDARKLGLYPSVTEILDVLNEPGLNNWKILTHIEAALTHPRDNRPVDDLIPEIKENAREFSRVAMELGTKIHDTIEHEVALIEGTIDGYGTDPDVPRATVTAFRDWYVGEGISVAEDGLERTFACSLGYAGRIDYIGAYHGAPIVIDWKTQKTKPGEKFKFYPKWAAQLAAYANGIGLPLDECYLMSVAISSTEPERIEDKLWTQNREYFDAFLSAFDLWKGPLGKNYDPLGKVA